jgi:predicted small lipoprotein YifL
VSFSSKTRLALTLAALAALAACGRYGDLQPPGAAVATPAPENRHSLDFHRTDNKITPPKQDFVLDPLLK